MRAYFSALVAAASCLGVAGACHAGPMADAAPADKVPAYNVVGRISGPDGGWDFANVAPATGQLYVARTNAVMAVDLASGRVVPQLAAANGAHQVLALDSGKTLVETDGKTGLTRFINAATGTVEAEVATGQKPDAAFYDAATGAVVVMSPGNDTITTIDAKTRKVRATMKLAGGLEFAVSNGRGGAFINLEDANAVAEVDLAAGKLLRKIAMPGCVGPTGLALVSGGTRLIAACANGVAAVINRANGKLLAILPIGKDADAVLVDEARGLAFVPCGGSGTLVELAIKDPDHITVAQTIPTQIGAKTGALDPRDGRIYLPAATLAPPEPGAKRGKPIPGTFVILVVAPSA
jgi:DNA-binding beta-propeller fold protein YncE